VLVDVAGYILKISEDKEERRYMSVYRSSHLYSRDSKWIRIRGSLKLLWTKMSARKSFTTRNENQDLQLSVRLTPVLIQFLSIIIK